MVIRHERGFLVSLLDKFYTLRHLVIGNTLRKHSIKGHSPPPLVIVSSPRGRGDIPHRRGGVRFSYSMNYTKCDTWWTSLRKLPMKGLTMTSPPTVNDTLPPPEDSDPHVYTSQKRVCYFFLFNQLCDTWWTSPRKLPGLMGLTSPPTVNDTPPPPEGE